MCILQTCAYYKHVHTTNMCGLQTCADYKHVQTTNMCRLQTCADYKHVQTTNMCRLQTCAYYKHVHTTNMCRLQTCAYYKHFHISTILQHFPLTKKSGLQKSQSCLCVWRVSPYSRHLHPTDRDTPRASLSSSNDHDGNLMQWLQIHVQQAPPC